MSTAANKAARKKRKTAKGKFHRIYNCLMKGVNEGEDEEVISQAIVDLELAYKELEGRNDAVIESIEPEEDEAEEQIKNFEDEITQMYAELCNARKGLAGVRRKKEEERNMRDALVEEKKLNIVGNLKEGAIKVKRLQAPNFSGNIREYPSFKKDYDAHMAKFYGKDPFALKSCLSGDALKLVQVVDDDYDEMVRRLNFKYGRAEKLVDVVLNDLRGLRKVEDHDNKKFIQMVDVIEGCYLDLKKIDLQAEMSTTYMLSEFEKKLPPTRMHEWALKKQSFKVGLPQFDEFLSYLKNQREAMEYVEEEVRQTSIKGRVNCTVEDEREASATGNHIQKQLEDIVRGLAHVAEIVSQGNAENKRGETIRKRCFLHKDDAHDIRMCPAFAALSYKERFDKAKGNGACFCCLQIGHISWNCSQKRGCTFVDPITQVVCNRFHHPLLHTPKVNGTIHTADLQYGQCRRDVLLMFATVYCKGVPLTVLYDPGASLSLISERAAEQLQLRGLDIRLSITKVGNTNTIQRSKEYTMPLKDTGGKEWEIVVCEIKEITAEVEEVESMIFTNLFPQISESQLRRPAGKVDLLIGADCCELLPSKVDQVGHLQLMKGPLGYCVRGSHKSIKLKSSHSVNNNKAVTGEIMYINGIRKSDQEELKDVMQQFFSLESLGTQTKPLCGRCGCGTCSIGSKNCSIQEEKELKMIEDGLAYDAERKIWTSNYPWLKDASNLPNNLYSAISRLKSLERRLLSRGGTYAETYHKQILDMVSRETAKKMDDADHTYEGAVHYIPHHEVVKKDSLSTPMRIVFNSSSSYMGQKLNDYWAKGPCVLNDMLTVLMNFRMNYVGVAGDVSKMYNSIELSIKDQHTHRFLWRNMELNREFDHYLLKTVTFGDKPSGTIAIAALRKTAELSKETFPEECDIIINKSYVDDIIFSIDNERVATQKISNIETVLGRGNFKIKHWIVSGSKEKYVALEGEPSSKRILQPSEEKVLGMIWDPQEDVFLFKVSINFGGKRDYTDATSMESVRPRCLTRRTVLSQLAKVYDPLGLVVPVILNAKVLMREICTRKEEQHPSKHSKWDDPLNADMQDKWMSFFKELFELQNLSFRRCIKPKGIIDDPVLIVFSDGSNLGYGCCAYVRWQVSKSEYDSFLLVAKNRIAPAKQITTPRLELCGAVLAARLREKIIEGIDLKFSSVFHITDSMIVRWQIQKQSYGFKSFVATRIGEIQTKTEPSEWWWIKSDLNPADLTTRITQPSQLGSDSLWQRGPEFLKKSISCWPISKDAPSGEEMTDRVGIVMTVSTDVPTQLPEEIIDIGRFSDYSKMLYVTALIILSVRKRTFKGINQQIDANALRLAETFWVKNLQCKLKKDWKVRYRRLGPMMNKEGIIVVGKRMSEWLKNSWNQDFFILIPLRTEFTRLYVKAVHEEDHAQNVDVTIAKIRRRFWIPNVRNVVKSIKNECMRCRLRNKKIEGQEMGDLPGDRFIPAPPFYNTVLDFFGPFWIKDTVKRRVKRKVFGVLFSSSTEHSVHLDLSEGYDTDSYLMVQRRFMALRGYPRLMRSDLGSQLVCANKELKETIKALDWRKISNSGIEGGTQWEFSKSADAPWENGLSESLVKLVKKGLPLAIGSHILTFAELQTVMFEVANLLNERPIGIKPNDPDNGTYLCPNDLLLGRASNRVPPGVMDTSSNLKRRWIFVQQIADTFWRKWQRDYFHTLIIRQRWHVTKRDVKVGDVVLVKDENTFRGNWRLAEVKEAQSGKDGRVRDVTVRYKNQNAAKGYGGQPDISIKRSVHKLAVILPIEERT